MVWGMESKMTPLNAQIMDMWKSIMKDGGKPSAYVVRASRDLIFEMSLQIEHELGATIFPAPRDKFKFMGIRFEARQ